jgi:aspartyl-tRNA(Asn)/glutamyl-tRNA(Gln) amidotransferase subunit C
MAELTNSVTKHVAKLAKLDLTQDEIEKFTHQLSGVIKLIEELGEVDTKGVSPTSQTTGLENIFREDKIDPTRILSQEDALASADNTQNGFFSVEKIIDKND